MYCCNCLKPCVNVYIHLKTRQDKPIPVCEACVDNWNSRNPGQWIIADYVDDPLFNRDPEWFQRYSKSWFKEYSSSHYENCRRDEDECYCMQKCGYCDAPTNFGPGCHPYCYIVLNDHILCDIDIDRKMDMLLEIEFNWRKYRPDLVKLLKQFSIQYSTQSVSSQHVYPSET